MNGSRRILVTRSEPGASDTAARLRENGFVAVVEPVFTLEPVAAEIPDFHALAFTSANGVRRFASLSPRRNAPVFTVGDRTAAVARDAGFTQVRSAARNVDALVSLILAELPASASLLHAGNAESRGDMVGRLQAAGLDAVFRALYMAVPVTKPGPGLAAHLSGARPIDAALIHSPRAAAILASLLKNEPTQTSPAIAAISDAAAAPLISRASKLAIATAPDEKSLLDALESLLRA